MYPANQQQFLDVVQESIQTSSFQEMLSLNENMNVADASIMHWGSSSHQK
jgi:hypothetical protein